MIVQTTDMTLIYDFMCWEDFVPVSLTVTRWKDRNCPNALTRVCTWASVRFVGIFPRYTLKGVSLTVVDTTPGMTKS